MFIAEPAMILLVALDDCLRLRLVRFVEYKDFSTLTSCFRKSWLALFGPPARVRCDMESAFGHDSFGIFLGCKREAIIAKDSHRMLGPLDRKINILRL